MNTFSDVCVFICSVVNNVDDLDLTIDNEELFYSSIKAHGLIGLVHHLVEVNGSEKLNKKLVKDLLTYVKIDNDQLVVINQIKTIFNKYKIKHIFLKGSHLKSLYPTSYSRSMGDIDVLVLEKDLKLVKKVLKELNFNMMSKSVTHHVYKSLNNILVEVHPGLYSEYKRYDTFLKSPFDYVYNNKDFEYELLPYYELMYLIYHLEKHFKKGGIGLRSLLDIGIFIKSSRIDETMFTYWMNQIGNYQFVKTVIYLNEKLFAIKSDFKFMEGFELDDELYLELITYINSSGIHGSNQNYNSFDIRVASSGSRLKFLLSRIFPGVKEMKGFYPVLNKCVLLLPLFYLVRLFKLTLIDSVVNIKKYRKVKASKNQETYQNLINKLEIR